MFKTKVPNAQGFDPMSPVSRLGIPSPGQCLAVASHRDAAGLAKLETLGIFGGFQQDERGFECVHECMSCWAGTVCL